MNPFPILETDRLLLRSLTLEDEAEVFALYSDAEITRCSEMVTLTERRQAAAVIHRFLAEFEQGSGIRWGIVEKASARLVGTCGVVWYPHNLSALLGYDLAREYWNRGLMTEALRAVVGHVFAATRTNRITATTLPDNPNSGRVLQKIGFQTEGVLREWGFWKGEFKDLRCFSLLRREAAQTDLCRRDEPRRS